MSTHSIAIFFSLHPKVCIPRDHLGSFGKLNDWYWNISIPKSTLKIFNIVYCASLKQSIGGDANDVCAEGEHEVENLYTEKRLINSQLFCFLSLSVTSVSLSLSISLCHRPFLLLLLQLIIFLRILLDLIFILPMSTDHDSTVVWNETSVQVCAVNGADKTPKKVRASKWSPMGRV